MSQTEKKKPKKKNWWDIVIGRFWECEYCGALFTSKKYAEYHEENCLFSPTGITKLKERFGFIPKEEIDE